MCCILKPTRRLLPLLLGVLSGCPTRETPPPRVTLGPARALADFKTPVTAGDSRGSTFVVGTALGRVLVRGAEGEVALGEPPHDAPVVAVALGIKERWLLSAGGRSIAAWNVTRGGLVRRVTGPQTITAAVLAPDGATAYFGTEQGHLLRWRLGQPRAEPLPQLACATSKVSVAQMRLPESRRCAFGVYVEPPQGGAICAYPVTALALRGGQLAAACREGTVSFNTLPAGDKEATGRRSFYLAGYLRTVTPVGAELVLLGRGEGELRVYDVTAGKVVRELQPAGAPDAAAADGELLAVAHGHRLHVWHVNHSAALASVPLPRRAVWLSLHAGELRVLLEDGRFVAHSVSLL